MSIELINSYQICAAFACAIAYDDTSGLEDSEVKALETWEQSVIADGGFITIDTGSGADNDNWGRCDVLNVFGEMINVNHLKKIQS